MSGAVIHPSAVVEKGAELGADVEIGPLCYVGPEVVLGDRVRLANQVSVTGATTIGADTRVQAFAALGGPPQDRKHKGGRTTLTIGANCDIREYVTMHRGTDCGRGATAIGDNCFILAYSHVGHDCIIGDGVTLTHASLGGHCEVGDRAILGAYAAVHQFVRIGHHAFLAATAVVVGDVIPYGMAIGNHARLRGFNIVGLKRAGMARGELMTLRAAYRMLFAPGRTVAENAEETRQTFGHSAAVVDILDFLASRGKRHFTMPALGDRGEDADDGDD